MKDSSAKIDFPGAGTRYVGSMGVTAAKLQSIISLSTRAPKISGLTPAQAITAGFSGEH
jgi:hypothetical protein